MMSFNDIITKYKFKKKQLQLKKNYQVLSSLSLNDVKKSLRDGPFSSDIGIVEIHPRKEHIGLYT